MRYTMKTIWLCTAVSLLTFTTLGKRPEAPVEDYWITGDISSDGVVTIGTQVSLWLSDSILAIDEGLLDCHVYGEEATGYELWPSADEPPLWIEGELPLAFAPSPWLEPECESELEDCGRYYFGETRLTKGEDDSRFDFEFSPHGPCTPRPWGSTFPVSDDPALWQSWQDEVAENPEDPPPPPLCPFTVLLLGGEADSVTGDVTFLDRSDFFYVRKGGYSRVLLYDFTLGPLCPEEPKNPNKGDEIPIPPGGCIKDVGGYIVGTGPVQVPVVFTFSGN